MNTEQLRAEFEAWWANRCLGVGTWKKVAWHAYQAGRAALQSQPQETIAYVTRNEEGDRAMLFFDLAEARLYCNPNEEPEALVLAGPTLQSQDAEDAQRYRKLRAMATQQADSLGPIFRIDVRRSAPYLFNFDAAIDHARRVEGGGDAI